MWGTHRGPIRPVPQPRSTTLNQGGVEGGAEGEGGSEGGVEGGSEGEGEGGAQPSSDLHTLRIASLRHIHTDTEPYIHSYDTCDVFLVVG